MDHCVGVHKNGGLLIETWEEGVDSSNIQSVLNVPQQQKAVQESTFNTAFTVKGQFCNYFIGDAIQLVIKRTKGL